MHVKLSFLGAAKNVTGSCYLLETENRKILVDCGLYQERQFKERNWAPFPVAAHTIDTVLLTHAHLDHCGLLPKLVKEGFQGKIYGTPATAEIAKVVMADAARIQTEDANYKKKRHQREGRKSPHPIEPIYTIEDADACAQLLCHVDYNQPRNIGDNIEVAFSDAGHIFGSSSIRVTVGDNDRRKSILFSGDVGRCDKPIINDPEIFDYADYVVCESTYGNRIHEPTADIKNRLCKIVNDTVKAGGNLIIPSFAIERAQEVLYYLNELLMEDAIPNLVTFLDSPMAINVTNIFRQHPEMLDEEMLQRFYNNESPFSFSGLTMSTTANASKAINRIRGTALIIAGSGMCTGGRVKHHLVNNISYPENTILFVGYQAIGTLGRIIAEKQKDPIRILGQHYPVKAKIEQIYGFSAHADRDELAKWLSGLKNTPKQVFVTHGEEDAANSFGKFLNEQKGWQTTVPNYLDEFILES